MHVDHGLRPGSADEADVVRGRGRAVRRGVLGRARVDVEPGPNLEARARAGALRACCRPTCCSAHTADDQAETVLLQPGARRRARRARGHAPRRPPSDPRPATSGDPPALRRPRARRRSTTRRTTIRSIVATGCATSCCRCSTTSPGATSCRCSPASAELARRAADDVADALAPTLDPTDADARCGRPPTCSRAMAVRAWLRPCSPDRHPPDAAAVDRVLAVAAGARGRPTSAAGGASSGTGDASCSCRPRARSARVRPAWLPTIRTRATRAPTPISAA